MRVCALAASSWVLVAKVGRSCVMVASGGGMFLKHSEGALQMTAVITNSM